MGAGKLMFESWYNDDDDGGGVGGSEGDDDDDDDDDDDGYDDADDDDKCCCLCGQLCMWSYIDALMQSVWTVLCVIGAQSVWSVHDHGLFRVDSDVWSYGAVYDCGHFCGDFGAVHIMWTSSVDDALIRYITILINMAYAWHTLDLAYAWHTFLVTCHSLSKIVY